MITLTTLQFGREKEREKRRERERKKEVKKERESTLCPPPSGIFGLVDGGENDVDKGVGFGDCCVARACRGL